MLSLEKWNAARAIECPFCKAEPGQPCTSTISSQAGTPIDGHHLARYAALNEDQKQP